MVNIKSERSRKKVGSVAIIGCGTIGGAFAQHLAKHQTVILYDRNPKKSQSLAETLNAKAVDSLAKAASLADIIILAIKPQDLAQLAPQLGSELSSKQILISVLAGTTTHKLKSYFKQSLIIRVMPNLAILKNQGAIAIAETSAINTQMKGRLESLFKPLGKLFWLAEDHFDAFNALVASGPAFAYVIMEAMVEAAVAMGFSHEKGLELILQMLIGSIALLQGSEKHPAELKWLIATPAGTTIAGLKKIEEEKVRNGVMQTFLAAYARAQELSAKR